MPEQKCETFRPGKSYEANCERYVPQKPSYEVCGESGGTYVPVPRRGIELKKTIGKLSKEWRNSKYRLNHSEQIIRGFYD